MTNKTVRPIIVDAVGDFVSVQELTGAPGTGTGTGRWFRSIRYTDQLTKEHRYLEVMVTEIPKEKSTDYVRAVVGYVEGVQDDMRMYLHQGSRLVCDTSTLELCDAVDCWCRVERRMEQAIRRGIREPDPVTPPATPTPTEQRYMCPSCFSACMMEKSVPYLLAEVRVLQCPGCKNVEVYNKR